MQIVKNTTILFDPIKQVIMGNTHKKNTASLINEQHRKAYV